MYVQLAMEVSGKERPAILCAGCGKYFVPLHGRKRYCEPRCRKRKWASEHRSSHMDILKHGIRAAAMSGGPQDPVHNGKLVGES